MRQYVLRRLIMLIPVMFGASLLIFVMMRVLPGNITQIILGEYATPDAVQSMNVKFGLDKPIYEQYVVWIWNAVRGDLGESYRAPGSMVASEIASRIPITLELAILAMIVSLAIAIPVGVISAVRQDTPIDYVARMISLSGLSIPSFWLGTLLITLPAIWFQWIPPLRYVSIFDDPSENLQQFMFPAVAMGAAMSAVVMRMTRSCLLEVLRQDYVRTAWSKGLRERGIIYRHALKNAMIPVITVLGNQFGFILGGTVIMESIFSLPGVGRLMFESITLRDYPMVQGLVLFIAGVFVVVNLAIDVMYAWFDPRIHYQ